MVPGIEIYDPLFSWPAIPGAASYEIEINPTAGFAPGSTATRRRRTRRRSRRRRRCPTTPTTGASAASIRRARPAPGTTARRSRRPTTRRSLPGPAEPERLRLDSSHADPPDGGNVNEPGGRLEHRSGRPPVRGAGELHRHGRASTSPPTPPGRRSPIGHTGVPLLLSRAGRERRKDDPRRGLNGDTCVASRARLRGQRDRRPRDRRALRDDQLHRRRRGRIHDNPSVDCNCVGLVRRPPRRRRHRHAGRRHDHRQEPALLLGAGRHGSATGAGTTCRARTTGSRSRATPTSRRSCSRRTPTSRATRRDRRWWTRGRSTTGRSSRPTSAGNSDGAAARALRWLHRASPSFQHASVPPTPIAPVGGAAASGAGRVPVDARCRSRSRTTRSRSRRTTRSARFSRRPPPTPRRTPRPTTIPVGATRVLARARQQQRRARASPGRARRRFVQTLPVPTITTADAVLGRDVPRAHLDARRRRHRLRGAGRLAGRQRAPDHERPEQRRSATRR